MPAQVLNLRSTDRITIAGLPGTGKTTLAKYLASLCEPHLLIYDPLGQYDTFPAECRYIPRTDELAEFEAVCRQLRARANLTFIIEECERYIGQNKPLGPNAFDLINRGRNWGIGIIGVTRRIQRVSKDFFDLCQHVLLYKCGLKSREYLTDMLDATYSRQVMKLKPYHFLHYSVEDEHAACYTLELDTKRLIYKAEKEVIENGTTKRQTETRNPKAHLRHAPGSGAPLPRGKKEMAPE